MQKSGALFQRFAGTTILSVPECTRFLHQFNLTYTDLGRLQWAGFCLLPNFSRIGYQGGNCFFLVL